MSEENPKPILPEAPKTVLPEAPKAVLPEAPKAEPVAKAVLPEAPRVAPVATKATVSAIPPSVKPVTTPKMTPPTPIVMEETTNPLGVVVDFASAAVCVAFAVLVFLEM